MKIRTKEDSNKSLEVNSESMSVISIDGDATEALFEYYVDRQSVVAGDVAVARVTIKAPTASAPVDKSTTEATIIDILSAHARIRDLARESLSGTIMVYHSDVRRYVSNNRTDTRTSTVFKAAAQDEVIVTGTNVLAAIQPALKHSRSVAQRLLISGTDPAMIASGKKTVVPATDRSSGVITPKKFAGTQLEAEYLKTVAQSTAIDASIKLRGVVIETESVEVIHVKDKVTIPAKIDKYLEITYTIELLRSDGTIASSISRTVKRDRLLASLVPTFPPKISAKRNASGACTVNLTQVDKRADIVTLYRTSFTESGPTSRASYERVFSTKLKACDGPANFDVDIGFAPVTILRAVSSNNVGTGNEFSSVVVRNSENLLNFSTPALTSRIIQEGISIDVRNISDSSISVVLKKKLLSAQPENGSREIITSFSVADHRDVYTYLDSDVQSGQIYEYTIDIVNENTTQESAAFEIVEYIPASSNFVAIDVKSLSVTSGDSDFDVSFSLTSTIVPKSLDIIKSALELNGLKEYYTDELLSSRDDLQKLLAHSVARVNLRTGEREWFGILTTNEFSDAALGATNGVTKLEAGTIYRYEITALMRSPETLLTKLSITTRDLRTKKEYTYVPSKYKHPIALQRGNLTNSKSILRNHSKEQFSFGITGSTTYIDVPIKDIDVTITQPIAARINADLIQLSWKVFGIEALDHFLVYKSGHAGLELIGKTHTYFDGDFTYNYEVNDRSDTGDVYFVCVPIYSDFSKGQEAVSNRITLAESSVAAKTNTTHVSGA